MTAKENIQLLYLTYFNRAADQSGLTYWQERLGFVRKVGSQATVDARHAYHRLKATCQLFIACGDAATFFKPAKAAFYRIPLTIFGFIEPSG
ncbi:hypothetical protein NYA30BAC_01427 [Halomonas sp. NYA30]